MKKILLVLKNILWTVIGFFFIPFSVLGFLLATNTTKGIGVYNEDGKLFIPVGILLLTILIVFCTIRKPCVGCSDNRILLENFQQGQ